MPHYSRLYKAVVDVPGAGHDRELTFWQAALGVELTRLDGHPEYHGAMVPGREFAVLVQRLEDGPARVHLDVHTDDLEAEVSRLERLGARRVRRAHGWCVMQDPASLLFCVLPQEPGSLNEENAQRWD